MNLENQQHYIDQTLFFKCSNRLACQLFTSQVNMVEEIESSPRYKLPMSNEFVTTPNSEKKRNLFSGMMKKMMKNVRLPSIFPLSFKVEPQLSLKKTKKVSFRQSSSPRPTIPPKNHARIDDDVVQVSNKLFDQDDNLAAESFAFDSDKVVVQSPCKLDVDTGEDFVFPILPNNPPSISVEETSNLPTSNPTDDPFQKEYSSGGDHHHSADSRSFTQKIPWDGEFELETSDAEVNALSQLSNKLLAANDRFFGCDEKERNPFGMPFIKVDEFPTSIKPPTTHPPGNKEESCSTTRIIKMKKKKKLLHKRDCFLISYYLLGTIPIVV